MSTATAASDVLVPDIGDFSDVPIVEILVSPGDTVAAEDPLVTLESDKATMDVPSPFGGVVQELKVKTGDAGGRRRLKELVRRLEMLEAESALDGSDDIAELA